MIFLFFYLFDSLQEKEPDAELFNIIPESTLLCQDEAGICNETETMLQMLQLIPSQGVAVHSDNNRAPLRTPQGLPSACP